MTKIERQPNTQYVLSLSYGKDSLACLGAIEQLGWPLDRIVHAEVWATDDIPADLPPMVEFKKKADKIIKERWGIDVVHICAMRKVVDTENFQKPLNVGGGYKKLTYERGFYSLFDKENTDNYGRIYGFQFQIGAWCNSRLKVSVLNSIKKGNISRFVLQNERFKNAQGKAIRIPEQVGTILQRGTENATDKKFSKNKESEVVQYLGIAVDEPIRIERHKGKKGILLPLVEIGWTEAQAKQWCIENDLLSPIYTDTCLRGGCWFCHNQNAQQLRELRHNYPDLWALLMKWDLDSPVSFKSDGHTVHDFDRRFQLEDEMMLDPTSKRFRWSQIDEDANLNYVMEGFNVR